MKCPACSAVMIALYSGQRAGGKHRTDLCLPCDALYITRTAGDIVTTERKANRELTAIEERAYALDKAEFERDYHDLTLSVPEVARRHYLSAWVVPTVAKILGIQTRKQGRRRRGKRAAGAHGCNENCGEWERCKQEQQNGYAGPLPCEKMVFPDENPELVEVDYRLTAWPAISSRETVKISR